MLVECGNCGEDTPEALNFCQSCKHKIRDLSGIVIDGKAMPSRRPKLEYFWKTGDPAVFSKPGDPDYHPAYEQV